MATLFVEIDESIQAEASETLAKMGLSVTDVVRMLLESIVKEHNLPFNIPNAETIQAMHELEQAEQKSRFNSIDSLMVDLNADD